jgi:subtilisin family serine protease
MVIGKVEICELYLSHFGSIQSIGQFELYTHARYSALAEIIRNEIDANYQHFLAQPVENEDKEKIVWYGVPYKENPIRFIDLPTHLIEKYTLIKNKTIQVYNELTNKLLRNGDTERHEYLDKALKFIYDDFIYCYDDKVVLGVWGMKPKQHITESFGEYVLDVFTPKPVKKSFTLVFDAGEHGLINGNRRSSITIEEGNLLNLSDIPTVDSIDGYTFNGWSNNAIHSGNFTLNEDSIIQASYSKIEPEVIEIVEEIKELGPEKVEESVPHQKHKITFQKFIDGKHQEPDVVKEFNSGHKINSQDIPNTDLGKKFIFNSWNQHPVGTTVDRNFVFKADYSKKLPWYIRFWNWLKKIFTSRFWRWLLWFLLILLLIWFLLWLFRSCNETKVNPIPSPIHEKPWVKDDPNVGNRGGIYDPGNPYETVPTPPEYTDVLPPNQGVMPPVDTSEVIRKPGTPVIVGNRLNILMENEDKSIMDLAKDFKQKYPSEKYKVVYYDDVVKRMQIEVPNDERAKLKLEIPKKFAPKYELFIFDESLFEGSYIPNDPAVNDPKKSWYLKTINAPNAWDISKGSPKITVAIVDNGFSLNHPELKNKVVMPYNVWLHSKDITAQTDDHGTHVAGTALAIANNGQGLSGIAPECAFMPVQVANKEGVMTTTSILDGILYALYQGADVINVSLGIDFEGTLPENEQRDLQNNHFKEEELLWNKVSQIANKHKAVIIVAAGNENMLAGINPMNRPKNFIIVSALDKINGELKKSGFSNYGEFSTVSAPGVDIYSSVGNNKYQMMSGTSMAAPIVTGAVALMKSLDKNLTSEQITCILQGTGKPANGKIGNLIQIDKALQKVKSKNYNDCSSRPDTPSSGDVQILLNWNNYNDLDLVCIDPNNETVWFKNKNVTSGGKLEIDMNVNYPDNKTPIENIFWPTGGAPAGTYQVYLVYYKKHTAINETPYTIKVKYGDKKEEFSGNIKREDKSIQICTFVIGENSESRSNNNSQNTRKEELLFEKRKLQEQLNQIDRELQGIKK